MLLNTILVNIQKLLKHMNINIWKQIMHVSLSTSSWMYQTRKQFNDKLSQRDKINERARKGNDLIVDIFKGYF